MHWGKKDINEELVCEYFGSQFCTDRYETWPRYSLGPLEEHGIGEGALCHSHLVLHITTKSTQTKRARRKCKARGSKPTD